MGHGAKPDSIGTASRTRARTGSTARNTERCPDDADRPIGRARDSNSTPSDDSGGTSANNYRSTDPDYDESRGGHAKHIAERNTDHAASESSHAANWDDTNFASKWKSG